MNFKGDFSFANFQIWENTTENWIKYFGKDNTNFLERYVDTNGISLKNIYVITTASSHIPYLQWERLVHALFFIMFPNYNSIFQKVFADNFYFEIWEGNTSKEGDGYTKIDKFVRTIVALGVKEKVYPDQYIELGLEVDIQSDLKNFQYFESKFLKNYNSNLLRSISYFFKTQYRNIAHFPEFEDIVNYCSAFQTFFRIEKQHDIGKKIAGLLANQFELNESVKSKLKEWMERFYEIRSLYTHGGAIDRSMLIYQNQRHIDIAGQVFQFLVWKKFVQDHFRTIETILTGIFESQPTFDEMIKLFTQKGAKEHFYSCDQAEFGKISELLDMLVIFTNTRIVVYKNKNKLKQALKSIIYIIEHLCNEYSNDEDKKTKYYIEPLKKIQEIISSSSSIEETIDRLPGIFANSSDPYHVREEIKVRDKISLGDILETFGKIREVYKGWNLL